MTSRALPHTKPLKALAHRLEKRSHSHPFTIYFVTGTDTGVGKTMVTCHLIRMLRGMDVNVGALKPVCCGDRHDAKQLCKAMDDRFDLELVNPIHLPRPVAPVAQPSPHWNTILSRTCRATRALRDSGVNIVLMEGAGGLLCPVARQHTMREIAEAVNARMIIVAWNRLGVLNHTLLTLEAAAKSPLEAIVLSRVPGGRDLSQNSNAAVLARWTRVPIYST